MRKTGETAEKTERKKRESKPHVFLLTNCETKGTVAEFSKNVESDAIIHARELLTTAEPGIYLLTKQVASLTVSDITTRKVARG